MPRNLKLSRPLAVFDIESTGVVPQRDRIVEIAILRVDTDGSVRRAVRRLNPQIPIPAGATAVHGITDADVAEAPTFAEIAEKLYAFLDGCDLAGYNITGFDIPILEAEFQRAGIDFKAEGRRVIDAYNIFCKLYPRTLSAAYKLFCGKDLEGAHGAAADTAATWEVIAGQLEKHPELPDTVDELAAYCEQSDPDAYDRARRFRWCGDELVVNFGKHAGRTLRDLAQNDPGFLRWILRSDFADDVKNLVSNALIGKFPERDAKRS